MAVSSNPVPGSQSESTQMGKTVQNQQQKRNSSPGLRVHGGRIYDSKNGKTCHQCRQKTMDFTARCKLIKNDKQCAIMFCHKCLLNRYGEKAEEVDVIDDWKCPKCRDICNCSICRKKKGHKPTGIMVHAAKVSGFSSVSQLLHVKGNDACQELIAKCKISSPKKSAWSTKDNAVKSPKKRGKENAFDGPCDMNSNLNPLDSSLNEKKAKKIKGTKVKELFADFVSSPQKANEETVLRRSPRKNSGTNEVKIEDVKNDDVKGSASRKSPQKSNVVEKFTKKGKIDDKSGAPAVAVIAETKNKKNTKVLAEGRGKSSKAVKDSYVRDYVMDVILPGGTLLNDVAGIDLSAEDAGYALQFLEFCSAFGEVLNIRKGQAECVLRDVMFGRRRKGKCSSAVQFFEQLLSFMFKDAEEEEVKEEEESSGTSPNDGDAAWIHSVKRCLSESELELEDLPENWINKGYAGYVMLEPSQKLRLLTFVCDESLSLPEMRKWMEEQNTMLVEISKEAKANVNAAKEKAKLIKRKMQEELVKALLERNGAPLSIAEHDVIISEIKAEANQAQEEMLEAMGLASNKRKRTDAVRTEPIIVDDNGRAIWTLKCLGDTVVLLQEMGALEQLNANDKWFSFNEEEGKVVEKYVSSLRIKRHKKNKLTDQPITKSSDLEINLCSAEDPQNSDKQ